MRGREGKEREERGRREVPCTCTCRPLFFHFKSCMVSRTTGTNMRRSQQLYEIFEPNLVRQLKNQATIVAECAEFTYCENSRWRQPPY